MMQIAILLDQNYAWPFSRPCCHLSPKVNSLKVNSVVELERPTIERPTIDQSMVETARKSLEQQNAAPKTNPLRVKADSPHIIKSQLAELLRHQWETTAPFISEMAVLDKKAGDNAVKPKKKGSRVVRRAKKDAAVSHSREPQLIMSRDSIAPEAPIPQTSFNPPEVEGAENSEETVQDNNSGLSKKDRSAISGLNLNLNLVTKSQEATLANLPSESEEGSSPSDTSEKRLLSADEEKKYGKQVQALLKIRRAQQHIFKKTHKRATAADLAPYFNMTKRKFARYHEKCEKSYHIMMNCNQRLVVSVARKIHKKRNMMDLRDLVVVGGDGLKRAVEKFDPAKGYKFSTYAHWWIRQAVNRYILEQRPVKVPIHLWETLTKIRKVQRDLRGTLHREPTLTEVGEVLGIDRDRVDHIIKAYRDAGSLDKPMAGKDGSETNMHELIVDPTMSSLSDNTETIQTQVASPEFLEIQGTSEHRTQTMVDKLLQTALNEKEANILRMRYGLDDGLPKTLDEVGERYQVTRERVRQIEQKVRRKLKLSNEQRLLHDGYDGMIDDSMKQSFTPKTGVSFGRYQSFR